jgi:hypothetical protein
VTGTDAGMPGHADSGHTPTPCVPGQSVACVGPGGCATNQVCAGDGNSFGACTCAGSADASRSPIEAGHVTDDAATKDATTNDATTTPLCVPGQSIACSGPGGCISNQVCNGAGSAYGACACGQDAGAKLSCIPGQSIACGGPYGCASFQVCDATGDGYGSCDCPDAASYLHADAATTPDGYAPLPPPVGDQGYNAIWSASAARVYLPLFSAPSCEVIPPYGLIFAVDFRPVGSGPVGTFSANCGSATTPCYEANLTSNGAGLNTVSTTGGTYTLSAFSASGVATGQMSTAQGIVPLYVKNCD